MTTQRDIILDKTKELAVSLLESYPEITEMVKAKVLKITPGEIAMVFEEKLRELVKEPVENGYYVSQAAHSVRMKKMHEAVAGMVAGG